tara:strand:- start:457 stop:2049 length:1593 start_codon:yes stop_codon:yes gene_type:complete
MLARKPLAQRLAKARKARERQNGFGMAEAVISLGASAVLVSASAAALSTTGSIITHTGEKTSLRQNASDGLRLLGSEVQRGLHLLIKTKDTPKAELAHTDLNNQQYSSSIKECEELANKRNPPRAFQPAFGIRMAELDRPVIYGLSTSARDNGYALERCGAPLSMDGRYGEVAETYIAPILEDIGVMPCQGNPDTCNSQVNPVGTEKSLNGIVKQLDLDFAVIANHGERTPARVENEPAFAIETDSARKLIKIVSPRIQEEQNPSYLEIKNGLRSVSQHDLHFAMYSRASKIEDASSNEQGTPLNGAFFRNVSSNRVRFLVDGSGSMSACILWGGGRGQRRTYWNSNRYISTRKICALTRMESLQNELVMIINGLPDDTKINIESFSSRGYLNHRRWKPSVDGLVSLADSETRQSAISFVHSLNDGSVTRWGGTIPWDGLDTALNDEETDTLYFLSDGEPNTNRQGRQWTNGEFSSTVDYYISKNDQRDKKIMINTTALGLNSNWMEVLANRSTGDYLMIDKNYITVAQQ